MFPLGRVKAEGKKPRKVKGKIPEDGKLLPGADPESQKLMEGYGPWAFLEIAERAGADETPEKERARYLIFLAEKWAGKERIGAETLSDLARIAIRAAELRKGDAGKSGSKGDISDPKVDDPKEGN